MKVLVAGVGNIFLGDDGFGCEVARRLSGEPLPPGVRVVDFGIRGVHLAYEVLEGYDLVVIVDATQRGGQPGTLYLIDPDATPSGEGRPAPDVVDAHGMDPASALELAKTLGGTSARVLVVGCEPATLEEGIGLSEPVAGAVGEAVRMIRDLIDAYSTEKPIPRR
jgi:hydrogenase maturation protease